MRGVALLATVLGATAMAWGQSGLLPNGSFEEGAQTPTGWELSAPPGEWSQQGRSGRCIAVTGDGSNSNYWSTNAVSFQPAATYEVSCWLRTQPGGGGGCLITGPSFANKDFLATGEWTRARYVIRTPDVLGEAYVRFGQWHFAGTAFYDDVALRPARPINNMQGKIELGHGESVDGDRYRFDSRLGGYNANYARTLHRLTAHFNSNRWVFFPGAEVVYRHQLPGVQHVQATVTVNVGWHARGSCIIEASADGQNWVQLGTVDAVATRSFDVPAELLPADDIFVRLSSPGEGQRGDSEPGNFQVYAYSFASRLSEKLAPMQGATSFLVVTDSDERISVQVESLGGLLPGTDNMVRLNLHNPGNEALTVTPRLELVPQDGAPVTNTAQVTVPAGGQAQVQLPYRAERVGSWSGVISVLLGTETLFAGEFSFAVPELYRSDFGYAIASDATTDLWWCEGTYKVSRERPAPERPGQEVLLEAARGEYEPVQVVLRPKRALRGLTATISDFTGPAGARIPASNVDVLTVGYVKVWRRTDAQGCEGWWPDPLPPLDAPLDLEADQNQPLWLRLLVPRDARPGQYAATLTLRAEGWSANVPVRLRVFDFELPDEHSITATMGFSAGNLRRYHHLRTDEQLRQVFDLYMRSFRAHRIDPYHPDALGPIRVELQGVAWNGGEVVSDNPAAGGHCLKLEDTSTTANIAANHVRRLPVQRDREYVIRFRARTATDGHVFMVTLGCHDGAGNWMSGRNVDVRYTGTTDWREYETKVPAGHLAEGCQTVSFTLRATDWHEPGVDTGTVWFDELFFGEDQPGAANLLSDPGFEESLEQVRLAVDFSDFDREMEHYLDRFGFQSFVLSLTAMPRRGAPGVCGPFRQGSEGYDRVVGTYLRELQEHLRAKGWLERAYTYWVDEPEPQDYENVRYGMRLLDQWAPDLRRMLTEQPEPELYGFVDIWCPVLSAYDEERCRARQAAGEQIWWYVCCGPHSPYVGLFIDHNAIDLRVWQWLSHKYDISGALIWTTNWWYSPAKVRETGAYQNPWDDPMSYTSEGTGYWGNGDGRFLYPPAVDPNSEHEPIICGPVDSLRWEMLREGLEDFEYFALLKRLLAQRPDAEAASLLTIPQTILVDPKTFNRDPQPLYAHRRALAAAIERLTR